MNTRPFLVLVALVILQGCPTPAPVACTGGLTTNDCMVYCGQFTTCGTCAAVPQCGWCDTSGSGRCVPTLTEDDHAAAPASCDPAAGGVWYFTPSSTRFPPGTPGVCAAPPESSGSETVATEGGSS